MSLLQLLGIPADDAVIAFAGIVVIVGVFFYVDTMKGNDE